MTMKFGYTHKYLYTHDYFLKKILGLNTYTHTHND